MTEQHAFQRGAASNVARYTIRKSLRNTEFLSGSFTTHAFRPHFHQSYTIILITEGIGDYSYGNKKVVVHEGGIVVFNPYDVHAGRALVNTPWRFKSMYVPVTLMQQALLCSIGVLGHTHFPPVVIRNKSLFDKGIRAFPDAVSTMISQNQEEILMDFLMPLIEQYAGKKMPDRIKVSETELNNLNQVKSYLHEHFVEDISLYQLCDMLGYTESKLIKRFKRCFHLPPKQYLINLKIEKAKALLLTQARCTDIAYQLGFFDQSHFIRHFKKIIGITPKQFIRNIN